MKQFYDQVVLTSSLFSKYVLSSFCFLFLNISLYSQVSVGSDVGVYTIDDAVSQQLITLSNGNEVTQDFDVQGSFSLQDNLNPNNTYVFKNLTITGDEITLGRSNIGTDLIVNTAIVRIQGLSYFNCLQCEFDNDEWKFDLNFVDFEIFNSTIDVDIIGGFGVTSKFVGVGNTYIGFDCTNCNDGFFRWGEMVVSQTDFTQSAVAPEFFKFYSRNTVLEQNHFDENFTFVLNNRSSLEFNNNTLTVTGAGIDIFNVDNGVEIKDNYFYSIDAGSSDENILNIADCGGVLVKGNDFGTSSSLERSMYIDGCPGAVVDDNVAPCLPIWMSSSDGLQCISNEVVCAASKNLSVGPRGGACYAFSQSMDAFICSNFAIGNEIGIDFSGDHAGLDFSGNEMKYNDLGLKYQMDVMADPQIEKGNQFDSNVFGAINENLQSGAPLATRFVVQDTPTEFPSHTPTDWFQNSGTTSNVCQLNIPPTDGSGPVTNPPIGDPTTGPDHIISMMCQPSIPDGLWFHYAMNTLLRIEHYPSLLTDPDINAFCTLYCNSTVDLLPRFSELQKSLPANDMDEPLRLAEIATLRQGINALLNTDPYVIDYIYTLNRYLDTRALFTLSPSDRTLIKNLAEDCVEDKGPAVYVAQIVARVSDIDFQINDLCLDLQNRSISYASDIETDELKIQPNPVSDYLEFDTDKEIETWTILNTNGKVLKTATADNSRVNVSDLSGGVYILRVETADAVLSSKFTKI